MELFETLRKKKASDVLAVMKLSCQSRVTDWWHALQLAQGSVQNQPSRSCAYTMNNEPLQ